MNAAACNIMLSTPSMRNEGKDGTKKRRSFRRDEEDRPSGPFAESNSNRKRAETLPDVGKDNAQIQFSEGGEETEEEEHQKCQQEHQEQQQREQQQQQQQESAAHIADLDSNLQESVSRYLDIHQWDLLKWTCKLFSSWPRPPPPRIEYHFIKFYFYSKSDHSLRGLGCCGIAKTLSDVVDACRHQCQLDEDTDLRREGTVHVDVQFLHVGDFDFPLVPLIEFEKRQRCGHHDIVPARIHRFGRQEIFNVREAGGDLPSGSAAREMMGTELVLYYHEDGGERRLR
eukprot:CAMPEP_0172546616 /NCGR_PEP_ID=MMETSP1067-20121228/16341_1 /TAXON_ID=265564 ORGANISM="Thalassiosira punctigera, Strain Tpunct2005C2" /NCGR_SAMPLE_ID=MMETSP1067 /ASSEMBLY_ACC=CAM_ASM_000444 /LENGTH=284 /DNA_ID=CAMNT_0013333579 /DNA_START=111 /DNA_END=962 /DNA_ORIENTATION=+